MPILRIEKVSLSYGEYPILDQIDFQIRKNEKVCLLGRNGSGKSTIIKIIEGTIEPDDGSIWRKPGLKVGVLNQDLPDQDEKTVYDVVASGLENVGELISRYHKISVNINTDADMKLLEEVQQQLESIDGWHLSNKVDTIIQRLGLPAEKQMKELSGGWRRRVELGKALVAEPDLLLLDEPTNHLDIIAISWLETQLKEYSGALLFITHDRSFLQSLATRIVELDRGCLTNWECNYPTFLERKAHTLEVEEEHNAQFDKKLAQEEVWIRQGIKARRTRNEGRVRDLKKLREERLQRRELQGNASFGLVNGRMSGKLVLEATDVSHSYDQHIVIKDLNVRIMRGDKVGLIGANGAGKSTLLSILLGDIQPDSGQVVMGTKLDVAYFDQLRNQLDFEKTVIDNVSEGRESITVNGSNRHIVGYLGDFLFPPNRCRVPVKILSGGERNRLLLARLFSKPANLLVMDEPTNDLDIETLDLLESLLVGYSGTLILVSHDRTFLNNVVSSTLVFQTGGRISEFVGGFDDWINQGGVMSDLLMEPEVATSMKDTKVPVSIPSDAMEEVKKGRKKLSYKLQRELAALPEEIELLEKELHQLETKTVESDFFQSDQAEVEAVLSKMAEINEVLEQKMERWQELEDMSSNDD